MAIKPEDEAELRVMAKQVFAHGGFTAILAVVTELGERMKIIMEVADEIAAEEENRRGEDEHFR